jgi:hypothetical protein
MGMIKSLTLAFIILLSASFLHAQSSGAGSKSTDPQLRHNDSIILADIILPLVRNASNGHEAPDWQVLGHDVETKYGSGYVDRTVTKAKIYYYFGKDWPLFSHALVHYTEAYEDKNDLRLMNKNARMVLQYSQSQEEWKAALSWVKHAVDKEPGNTAYKATYDGLDMKIRTAPPKG